MHWVGRGGPGAVIVGDRHALAIPVGMAAKVSIYGTHNGKAAELRPDVDVSIAVFGVVLIVSAVG